jgi:O-antigen/teichoic acid export membrane protein
VQAATSLFSTSMLLAVNGNYPLLVAGLFVSAPDLGVFRVALASAALVALPTAIANIAVGPLVARLAREGDARALADTISHTTAATFLSTALGFLLLLAFGEPLITLLFGAEYVGAYRPLLILGAAQLIVSAFGIAGTYLNLTGGERLVLRAFILTVPIGLLVAVPLTWAFGIAGAATGNLCMVILWHWYVIVRNRRRIDVPLSLLAAWRHFRLGKPASESIH